MIASQGISVVVPVYNGAATLGPLVSRLGTVLAALEMDYEILLVNDGSWDSSWSGIVELAESEVRVRGIDLMRNYGQHNALLAGIREARYDTTVTLDDDLQNPPEEIPLLLATLQEGYDVVYGTPRRHIQGFWRNLATRLARLALRVAIGSNAATHVSAFRAFRTGLRDAFVDFSGPYVSVDVLLSWATTRFGAVTVEHHARAAGRSNYSFFTLARHAFNVLTGFSTRPLRFASLIGLLTMLFGVGVLVLVIIRFFAEGGGVPGFPFLASVIAIFAGAQLLSLGLIGEYLARVHMRVIERPTYTVREEVGALVEVERQTP